MKQKDYLDKDIRPKLIEFLTKKHNNPVSKEVTLGEYRADLFVATSQLLFVYEIKSFKDDYKRFFKDQLPNYLWATERIFSKITLVIPKCQLQEIIDYCQTLDIESRRVIGVITYSDKLAFKVETNIYIGKKLSLKEMAETMRLKLQQRQEKYGGKTKTIRSKSENV